VNEVEEEPLDAAPTEEPPAPPRLSTPCQPSLDPDDPELVPPLVAPEPFPRDHAVVDVAPLLELTILLLTMFLSSATMPDWPSKGCTRILCPATSCCSP